MYLCRKKRTAVFPFKKRTKHGKNVLVGRSVLVVYNQVTTILLVYNMYFDREPHVNILAKCPLNNKKN